MSLPTNHVLKAAVKDIADAAKRPNPLRQIETLLHMLTNRFHASGGLVHEEEDDEILLHSEPGLTIYHITLSPGLQYPPHNHHMDALIGIYQGGETNFIYPVEAGKLGAPERRDFAAPALVHLPPHSVHSVANTGSARSNALHVYLGDLRWRSAHRHLEVFASSMHRIHPKRFTVEALINNLCRPNGTRVMPKLLMLMSANATKQIALGQPETSVGRASGNDIVIKHARVSRFHAVLIVDGPFVTIKDLASSNGVYVNDIKVDTQHLVDGDNISIGGYRMRFLAGDQDFTAIEALRLLTIPGLPIALASHSASPA